MLFSVWNNVLARVLSRNIFISMFIKGSHGGAHRFDATFHSTVTASI
jgi:hypothetical protein